MIIFFISNLQQRSTDYANHHKHDPQWWFEQVCRTARPWVEQMEWPAFSLTNSWCKSKLTSKWTFCQALEKLVNKETKREKMLSSSSSMSIDIIGLPSALSSGVILQQGIPCPVITLILLPKSIFEGCFQPLVLLKVYSYLCWPLTKDRLSGSYFMFQQTEKSNGFDWSQQMLVKALIKDQTVSSQHERASSRIKFLFFDLTSLLPPIILGLL